MRNANGQLPKLKRGCVQNVVENLISWKDKITNAENHEWLSLKPYVIQIYTIRQRQMCLFLGHIDGKNETEITLLTAQIGGTRRRENQRMSMQVI